MSGNAPADQSAPSPDDGPSSGSGGSAMPTWAIVGWCRAPSALREQPATSRWNPNEVNTAPPRLRPRSPGRTTCPGRCWPRRARRRGPGGPAGTGPAPSLPVRRGGRECRRRRGWGLQRPGPRRPRPAVDRRHRRTPGGRAGLVRRRLGGRRHRALARGGGRGRGRPLRPRTVLRRGACRSGGLDHLGHPGAPGLAPVLQRRLDEEVGAGVVERLEVLGPGRPSWRKGALTVPGRGPRDTYG